MKRSERASRPAARAPARPTETGPGGAALTGAQRRLAKRRALLDELVGEGSLPDSLRGRLLRTSEVALLFQVSERAVTDWARRGRIPSVRTPGGHRRYPADRIWALLESTGR